MDLATEIGSLLEQGKRDAAIALLDTRIIEGDGEAAFVMGIWRMEGDLVPRDMGMARRLFAKGAESGFAPARAPHRALLASGAGCDSRDWSGALASLGEAAASDPEARRQRALIDAMELDEGGDPRSTYMPEFLSQDPLVVLFRKFLTPEECGELIRIAETRLAPAVVVDPASGRMMRDPVRDSLSAAFPLLDESPFIHAMNRRIAAASRSRVEQGEPVQVLAYRPGQQYKLHSDALPGEANQRIQTMLVYLNDDFTGGATHFPHGDLNLRPEAGDAICFSNVDSMMRSATTARHAGLPVESGTKFILSRWIRRYPLDLSGGIAARR